MKRVTQTEIARIVGVSQRAVAAVVGSADLSKVRVSEATRLHILRVAKELGYRPQRQAQLLRGVRSGSIGIINDISMLQHCVELVFHISMKAHQAGYHLLNQDLLWSSPKEVDRILEILVDARVEAVLLLSVKSDIDLTLLRKAGIPVIAIGVSAPEGIPYVAPDFSRAMRELVLHLSDLGHRRMAYVSPAKEGASSSLRDWNQNCIAGILEGMRTAGLSRDDVSFLYGESPEQLLNYFENGYRIGAEWEGELPDAILCHSDHCAMGLYKAFSDRGIRVPQDVAITGFSGSSLGAYCPTPITSVEIPTFQMSELALDSIFSVIRDNRPLDALPQSTLLPCQIVPRASSGGRLADSLL